ncbi:MAG: hypothetical protein JNK54_07820 [Elusimicrobia bacterium]|nr:hypothetical protein [Elusimicrobiota bacterium]
MDLPLKDLTQFINRAFEILSKSGEIEAFRTLSEEFKDCPQPQIDELLHRLKSLKGLAFEMGNEIHDHHYSREVAIERLKIHCPGFTEDIYQSAISKGLYEAMW